MLFDDKTKGIAQAYLSMLGESHFKVGDKVKCKASGMNGTVTKLDKEDGSENEKYYTVKQDSGKVMKYTPNELSKLSESVNESFFSNRNYTMSKTATKDKNGIMSYDVFYKGKKIGDVTQAGNTWTSGSSGKSPDDFTSGHKTKEDAFKELVRQKGMSESKLDPVNPKEVKKKFDDRMDKDIDNDGDVDSSDEYLHKRRKAISKAVKKEAIEIEMQKKSKMNGSDDDDDDDDEDMVAKGNDKMKVKKNSKKDNDDEGMKESRVSNPAKGTFIKLKTDEILAKNQSGTMKFFNNERSAKRFANSRDKSDIGDGWDEYMNRANKGGKMSEDVEELDELSKKTMGSYVKKASDDRMWSGVKAADNSRSSSTQDAASRRATKRKQGIAKATDRLTKENLEWNWDAILEAPEEEIDAMIEEMSDDDLESFVSEFEQLDEVSTGTLARAANAAADPDADVRYGMKGHDPQKFADYAKRKKGAKAAAAVQGAADGKGYSRPGRSSGMDKMKFRQNRSTNPNMVTKSGKLSKTAQKGLKTQMKESDNWYQASTNTVQPMNSDGRETLDPRAPADRAFANAHRQDVNIKDYPGKDKPVTNAKPQAPVRPGEKRNPEPRKTLSDIRNKMK